MAAENPRKNLTVPLAEVIAECDCYFNANQPEALGEHLRYWLERARELNDRSSELSLQNELMGHYRMQRDEVRALQAVKAGVELLYQLHADHTVSGGTILINAATVLQSFDHIAEALKLYTDALDWYTTLLPPGDRRLAGLFNNMASAFENNGELRRAEELYLQALEILQQHNELMDAAVTYVNLARLYARSSLSDPSVNTALDCAMYCFDSPTAVRNGYYAHTCGKCAPVFAQLERSKDAEELLARAENIYENT